MDSDSNRAQASGFNHLFKIRGYSVELTDEWEAVISTFTADDVEIMSKAEHDRWCRYQRSNGWKWGTARDNDKRIHPDLVPWEELSEPSREKDRETVRELPEILVRYGIAVVHDRPPAAFPSLAL